MAKKNEEVVEDLFKGASRAATSVYAHGGDTGCAVAFALFLWILVMPAIICALFGINMEDIAIFWYVFVTPFMGSVIYESYYRQSERRESLKTAYSSYTSTWLLTRRENKKEDVYALKSTAENPSLLSEIQDDWRETLPEKLAEEHIKYETTQRVKVSVEERIATDRDLWILYRVSQLIPQYTELTKFWVPSFEELHPVVMSKFSSVDRSRKLFSMRYLRGAPNGDFDPFMDIVRSMVSRRTEELAYQHAELEYDRGETIPLIDGDVLPENYIQPPEKSTEDKIEDDTTEQDQDEKPERVAYVDRTKKYPKCPFCSTTLYDNYPFCPRCDATIKSKRS